MSSTNTSTTNATTDDARGRFPSLGSLRAAHGELLQRRRDSGDTPEFLDEVASFIQRGRATGVLLDSNEDRKASQSLLDYWANMLYRASREPPDATLADFNLELAPELDDAACPYLGLDAFQEAHHDVFFGRQRLVEEMVDRLHEDRLLAVVGPSGSGKSSVVLAGLLPALKDGAVPGSQAWHYYPRMVPGSNPLANLARLLRPSDTDAAEWTQRQVERFQQDAAGLTHLIDELGDAPAVLVVDQFEEVFTLCDDDRTRQAFTDSLLGLIQSPGARHTVILTMRTDFEPHVAGLGEFRPLFEEAQVRVLPLSPDELREAIEEPAERANLQFEEGVVDALLQDILGAPAALPLLQFTLLKLWEDRKRNRVTRAAYDRLGGGRKALERSADEFYESMIGEDQDTVRYILLRMVRLGEGLEVTSSRIRREMLYQAGPAPDRVDRVLEELVKSHLVRLTEGDTEADAQVEVAHEALVRNWHRLVGWLKEAWSTMTARQRLEAKAQEWVRLGRGSSGLLCEVELLEAQNWLDSPDAVLLGWDEALPDLVEASHEAIEEAKREKEAARQREIDLERARAKAERLRAEQAEARETEQARAARRLRDRALALVAVFLVAVGAAAAAWMNFRTAQENYEVASINLGYAEDAWKEAAQERDVKAAALVERDAALTKADSSLLAARAMLVLESDPQLSLLLAVEAANITDTVTAEQALRQALHASRARAVLHSHVDRVNTLAFSTDEPLLATGGADGTVRLWDVASGDERDIESEHQHQGSIVAVAFVPDDHRLITASNDATIRIWNPSDLEAAPTVLEGHKGSILTAAFSSDGHLLVTGSDDTTVRFWDLTAPWAEPAVLAEHEDAVDVVALSPDGRRIASASRDGTAWLWDAEKGAELAALSGHTSGINALAFSPSGELLATAGADGTTRLWDADSGIEWDFSLSGHVGSVTTLAFSPDGLTLATGSDDGTVRLWRPFSGEELPPLRGHEDSVNAIAFSPDHRWLATGSADGTARLWDAFSGEELFVLRGHTSSVGEVVFSPDGALLATASSDTTARLWAVTGGEAQVILRGHEDSVYGVAFSPVGTDGPLLATGSDDRTVRLWNLSTALKTGGSGAEVATLRGEEAFFSLVAFSSDSSLLAAGSQDGRVRLWNTSAAVDTEGSDAPVATLEGHEGFVHGVCFGPDETPYKSLLATSSEDGTARLWNVTTALDERGGDAEVAVLDGHEDTVWSVAFSPDGTWLATSGADGTIRLWDVPTARETGKGEAKIAFSVPVTPVVGIAFSPDGKLIAGGSGDGTTRLWDAFSGEEVAVLHGHEGLVIGVAYNRDGDLLATGSLDGTARLWDVPTALDTGGSDAEVSVLRDYLGEVHYVAFSPDGRWLASSGSDVTVQLHPMGIEGVVMLACNHAARNLTQTEWETYFGDKVYHKTCKNVPVHYSVIRELVRQDEVDVARGWTSDEEVALALVEVGQEYLDRGEHYRALGVFRQAVELDPILHSVTEAKVAFAQGRAYLDQDEYDRAGDALSQAVELDPALRAEAAQVLVEVGQAYLDQGEYDKALDVLSQAVELNPTLKAEAAQILIEVGQEYLYQGEYDKALDALSQAVELDPQIEASQASELAWVYNSVCWNGSLGGQAEQVLSACERAVELEPDNGAYIDSRGLARALSGDLVGAIDDFQFYVEWGQDRRSEEMLDKRRKWIQELEAGGNPFDGATLAQLRYESGEVVPAPEAISEAEMAIAEGLEYARQGQIDAALAALQRADELDPQIEIREASGLAEAYNEVCRQGYAQGLEETVLPACKRAVELAIGIDNPSLSYIVCLDSSIAGLAEVVSPACEHAKGLATQISFGETVTGVVEAGGRYVWTFEGTEGQIVTIAMGADDSELDTYLTLLGPDGAVLAEDDDGGEGPNSRMGGFTLQETGTHAIVARGFGNSAGAYTLTLIDQTDH